MNALLGSLPGVEPDLLASNVSGVFGCDVSRGSMSRPVITFSYIKPTNVNLSSTQLSISPGYVKRVPTILAGVRWGAFTCVGWQETLSDPL